jgi:hypothetical protein
VQHCCDHQFDVAMVDAGQGVAEAHWYPAGEACCQAEYPFLPAFSELCKPSCKVGMSHQVTLAAQGLKARRG